MRRFFSNENPLIAGLAKLADLMWINALFIICCIPVVTIGVSTTALYYTVMKVIKNEESYITKDFFKSIKDNFKVSTIIWIFFALLLTLFGTTFYVLLKSDLSYAHIAMGIIGIPMLLIAFTLLYAFPLIATYDNSVLNTMMNALLLSLAKFPITVLMALFSIIPIYLVLSSWAWFPIIILGAFAVVAYVNGSFLNKIFDKIKEDEKI